MGPKDLRRRGSCRLVLRKIICPVLESSTCGIAASSAPLLFHDAAYLSTPCFPLLPLASPCFPLLGNHRSPQDDFPEAKDGQLELKILAHELPTPGDSGVPFHVDTSVNWAPTLLHVSAKHARTPHTCTPHACTQNDTKREQWRMKQEYNSVNAADRRGVGCYLPATMC